MPSNILQQEDTEAGGDGLAGFEGGIKTGRIERVAVKREPHIGINLLPRQGVLILVVVGDAQHDGQQPPIKQIATLEKIADGAQQLVEIVFDVVHEKSLWC